MDKETVAKGLDTRDIGDEYEDEILELIHKYDEGFIKTKGSGAVHNDGDIVSQHHPDRPQIAIDAKWKGNAKSAIATDNELEKIALQAAMRGRKGIIITPSKTNKMVAMLPLTALLELIYGGKNG